jgi:hypothetical protein
MRVARNHERPRVTGSVTNQAGNARKACNHKLYGRRGVGWIIRPRVKRCRTPGSGRSRSDS